MAEPIPPLALDGLQAEPVQYQPTIIEVWAPSCAECRAMQTDIDFTAAEFTGSVRLVMINAAEQPELARSLGALATPTLIGVSGGKETFRAVGRRTRSELHEMFRAVETGEEVSGVGRHDRMLRTGAGVSLILLGAVTGPAWPLIGIGSAISAWGVTSRGGARHD